MRIFFKVLPLALLSILILGCSEKPRTKSDSDRRVRMFMVGSAENNAIREFPGTIAAAQEVELGFEVAGRIIEFPLKAGEPIKAGDLLAKLDPTSFNATVAAAKAQWVASEADVVRKRELIKVGGVSRVALEEAERRYTAAKSDLATAEKGLSDAELRAPFDGIIAKTMLENFANVQARQPVVTIQDPSWMEIRINIPEADAILAVPGLTLRQRNERINPEVILSALPNRPFAAQLTEFATTADPVTRTYEVTLVFARVEGVTILPGMSAHVAFKPGSNAESGVGLRVPARAVVGDASGSPYVWTVDKKLHAHKRAVKVGEIDGSMIQIAEGLEKGDRIAVTGVHSIQENLLLRQWEAK